MPIGRIGPTPGDVVVIRSGYATEALWWHAINQALRHGRDVQAIDGEGHSVRFLAADGLIQLPEIPDW